MVHTILTFVPVATTSEQIVVVDFGFGRGTRLLPQRLVMMKLGQCEMNPKTGYHCCRPIAVALADLDADVSMSTIGCYVRDCTHLECSVLVVV